MSKRQEKIAARQAEQAQFLKARERFNMSRFIQAHELGKQLFEQGKDKLTDGEIAMLEAQMSDNEKFIAEYKEREGLNAEPEQETPGLPDTEVSS
jgi:hypothetical protein